MALPARLLVDGINEPLLADFGLTPGPLKGCRLSEDGRELRVFPATDDLSSLTVEALPLSRLRGGWRLHYTPVDVEAVMPAYVHVDGSLEEAIVVGHGGGLSIWCMWRNTVQSIPLELGGAVVAAHVCIMYAPHRQREAVVNLVVAITAGGLVHSQQATTGSIGGAGGIKAGATEGVRVASRTVRLAQICRVYSDLLLAVLYDGESVSVVRIDMETVASVVSVAPAPATVASLGAFVSFSEKAPQLHVVLSLSGDATRSDFIQLTFAISGSGVSSAARASFSLASREGPVRLFLTRMHQTPLLAVVTSAAIDLIDPLTHEVLSTEEVDSSSLLAGGDLFVDATRRIHLLTGSGCSVIDGACREFMWMASTALQMESVFDLLVAFDILQDFVLSTPFAARPLASSEEGQQPFLFEAMWRRHIDGGPLDFPPTCWKGVRALLERINASGAPGRAKEVATAYLVLACQPQRVGLFASHYQISTATVIEARLYLLVDGGLYREACEAWPLLSDSMVLLEDELVEAFEHGRASELLPRLWGALCERLADGAAGGGRSRFVAGLLLGGHLCELSRICQSFPAPDAKAVIQVILRTVEGSASARPASIVIAGIWRRDVMDLFEAACLEDGPRFDAFMVRFWAARRSYRKALCLSTDSVGPVDPTVHALLRALSDATLIESGGAMLPSRMPVTPRREALREQPQTPVSISTRTPSSPRAQAAHRAAGASARASHAGSPVKVGKHHPKLPSRLAAQVQISSSPSGSSLLDSAAGGDGKSGEGRDGESRGGTPLDGARRSPTKAQRSLPTKAPGSSPLAVQQKSPSRVEAGRSRETPVKKAVRYLSSLLSPRSRRNSAKGLAEPGALALSSETSDAGSGEQGGELSTAGFASALQDVETLEQTLEQTEEQILGQTKEGDKALSLAAMDSEKSPSKLDKEFGPSAALDGFNDGRKSISRASPGKASPSRDSPGKATPGKASPSRTSPSKTRPSERSHGKSGGSSGIKNPDGVSRATRDVLDGKRVAKSPRTTSKGTLPGKVDAGHDNLPSSRTDSLPKTGGEAVISMLDENVRVASSLSREARRSYDAAAGEVEGTRQMGRSLSPRKRRSVEAALGTGSPIKKSSRRALAIPTPEWRLLDGSFDDASPFEETKADLYDTMEESSDRPGTAMLESPGRAKRGRDVAAEGSTAAKKASKTKGSLPENSEGPMLSLPARSAMALPAESNSAVSLALDGVATSPAIAGGVSALPSKSKSATASPAKSKGSKTFSKSKSAKASPAKRNSTRVSDEATTGAAAPPKGVESAATLPAKESAPLPASQKSVMEVSATPARRALSTRGSLGGKDGSDDLVLSNVGGAASKNSGRRRQRTIPPEEADHLTREMHGSFPPDQGEIRARIKADDSDSPDRVKGRALEAMARGRHATPEKADHFLTEVQVFQNSASKVRSSAHKKPPRDHQETPTTVGGALIRSGHVVEPHPLADGHATDASEEHGNSVKAASGGQTFVHPTVAPSIADAPRLAAETPGKRGRLPKARPFDDLHEEGTGRTGKGSTPTPSRRGKDTPRRAASVHSVEPFKNDRKRVEAKALAATTSMALSPEETLATRALARGGALPLLTASKVRSLQRAASTPSKPFPREMAPKDRGDSPEQVQQRKARTPKSSVGKRPKGPVTPQSGLRSGGSGGSVYESSPFVLSEEVLRNVTLRQGMEEEDTVRSSQQSTPVKRARRDADRIAARHSPHFKKLLSNDDDFGTGAMLRERSKGRVQSPPQGGRAPSSDAKLTPQRSGRANASVEGSPHPASRGNRERAHGTVVDEFMERMRAERVLDESSEARPLVHRPNRGHPPSDPSRLSPARTMSTRKRPLLPSKHADISADEIGPRRRLLFSDVHVRVPDPVVHKGVLDRADPHASGPADGARLRGGERTPLPSGKKKARPPRLDKK